MRDLDIQAVWAQVPSPGCKGLCQQSCGPVAMSPAEEALLNDRGVTVGFDRKTLTCDQLNGFGRCSIYTDRPLVCRLWSAVPEMPCPWGCAPTMRPGDGHKLLRLMNGVRA